MVRTSVLAALLLALLVAGCSGGGGGYEMSAQEQQLKTETVSTLQSVDTYRMEGEVSVSGDDVSVTGEVRGVVDRPNRQARVDIDMSGDASVQATTYIVNDTAYVNARGMWRTVDVSDRNVWDRNARLEQQREIFQAADFELVGNDTVGGEPVRVVKIHIPDGKLDDLAALAQTGEGSNVDIQEATYTAYVDTESDRLRRTDVEMTMKTDGRTFDADVTMTFSDFGESVTIQVPKDAKGGIGPTASSVAAAG